MVTVGVVLMKRTSGGDAETVTGMSAYRESQEERVKCRKRHSRSG